MYKGMNKLRPFPHKLKLVVRRAIQLKHIDGYEKIKIMNMLVYI